MSGARRARRGRRGHGKAAAALAVALGLCSAILLVRGLGDILHDWASEARYAAASRHKVSGPAEREVIDSESDIDWESLRQSGANPVAWLSVAGTPIDYPVAQGDAQEPDFYLTHDLWGTPSGAGCPYIDSRTSATATHALVYGHHMGTTGLQFSAISEAYRQDVFEGLGTLTWQTPDGKRLEMEPLCAAVVDMAYQPIQKFPEHDEDLSGWLEEIVAGASARSQDVEGLASECSRVVTLVTCSSTTSGQRGRTIVLFAR